jgi:hypothetical protein
MPNVKPTKITTDSAGSSPLNLQDGIAFFPKLGAIRLGTRIKALNGTWCEKTLNFEVFKFDINVSHESFLGACGPAYALDIETDAATSYTTPAPGNPSSGELVVKDASLRGGFQFGVDFGITIAAELDFHYGFGTKKLLSINDSISLDLMTILELVIDVIEAMLAEKSTSESPGDYELGTIKDADSPDPDTDEGSPSPAPAGKKGVGVKRPEYSSSGLVDYVPKAWFPGAGQSTKQHQAADDKGNYPPAATVDPQLSWNFNVIPLFEGVPFLDALYAFDEAWTKISGDFAFGPGFAVGLPTTVRIKGATIGHHRFDVTEAETANSATGKMTLTLAEQTPVDESLQPLGAEVQEIGVLLEHEVAFELDLYFFISFGFGKVFHLGAQTGNIPIIDVPIGGPYETPLSFVPGGGPEPFLAPMTAPAILSYDDNQPRGPWKEGITAHYAISYYDDNYETVLGPPSPETSRFFAGPIVGNLETYGLSGDEPPIGRRIYRQFNDGTDYQLVAEIPDQTSTQAPPDYHP